MVLKKRHPCNQAVKNLFVNFPYLSDISSFSLSTQFSLFCDELHKTNAKFLPPRQFLILFTKTIKLTNSCRFVSNDLLTDKFTSRFQEAEKYRGNGVCLIKSSSKDLCVRHLMEKYYSLCQGLLFLKGSILNRAPTFVGRACVSLMECVPIVSINVPSVVSACIDVILLHCYANHNSNISLVTYGTLFHSVHWLDL